MRPSHRFPALIATAPLPELLGHASFSLAIGPRLAGLQPWRAPFAVATLPLNSSLLTLALRSDLSLPIVPPQASCAYSAEQFSSRVSGPLATSWFNFKRSES